MTQTLTSIVARDMVQRIEAKQAEIEAIYAEARTYDGQHNDNVIRDAVEARARQRDAASDAEALIGSFDWNDEGERIVPEAAAAWPVLSERLKAELADQPKALRTVGQIDRLFALSVDMGLPQPTLAEVEGPPDQ